LSKCIDVNDDEGAEDSAGVDDGDGDTDGEIGLNKNRPYKAYNYKGLD
jgi:hypothetical protein